MSAPTPRLTRAQKAALARALLRAAGDAVEFWSDFIDPYDDDDAIKGIDAEKAAEQFARWLRPLRRFGWDTRLPEPPAKSTRFEKESR